MSVSVCNGGIMASSYIFGRIDIISQLEKEKETIPAIFVLDYWSYIILYMMMMMISAYHCK